MKFDAQQQDKETNSQTDIVDQRPGDVYLCALQCCLDFSRQVLKLQSVDEDGSGEDQLPFLTPPSDSQCQHDTNENL